MCAGLDNSRTEVGLHLAVIGSCCGCAKCDDAERSGDNPEVSLVHDLFLPHNSGLLIVLDCRFNVRGV